MKAISLLYLVPAGISALWIFIQDFRTREVHVIPLVLLSVAGIISGIISHSFSNITFNIGAVFIIILIPFIYFRLRGRKNFFDSMLGWGDVFMLIAFACWFPPFLFGLGYFIALICALTVTLITIQSNERATHPVPLAGWLSLSWFLMIAIEYLVPFPLI